MRSGFAPLLCFFINFCVIILAINLPVQHSIHNPHLSDLPSTPASNSSFSIMKSTSTPSPNNPVIDPKLHKYANCQSELYGLDLNKASCQLALQLMPTGPKWHTYATRDTGNPGVVIPHRYLSRKLRWSPYSAFFYRFSFQLRTDGKARR